MLHDTKFSDGRATNLDNIYRRVKVSEWYNWYCHPNCSGSPLFSLKLKVKFLTKGIKRLNESRFSIKIWDELVCTRSQPNVLTFLTFF